MDRATIIGLETRNVSFLEFRLMLAIVRPGHDRILLRIAERIPKFSSSLQAYRSFLFRHLTLLRRSHQHSVTHANVVS